MTSRRVLFTILFTVVLLAALPAQSLISLEPVLRGQGQEFEPSVNDEYIAYSYYSRKRPGQHLAYAKSLSTDDTVRLNAPRTDGFMGAIDPGTNRVIYQQWTRRESGLYFYDLDAGKRTKAAGVNSRRWDWGPRISSRFITFLRDRRVRGVWFAELFAYERSTGKLRRVGSWRESAGVVVNGMVGDRYLTYTRCTERICSAFLYNWDTKRTKKLPNGRAMQQYAPVVDEAAGVVYFIRSGDRCGQNVSLRRLPISLAGDPQKIVDLPRGVDVGATASIAANTGTGRTDLYLFRIMCRKRSGDIYAARSVDAVT